MPELYRKMAQTALLIAGTLILVFPNSVWAFQSSVPRPTVQEEPTQHAAAPQVIPLVWFDYHARFRLRPELVLGGGLGSGDGLGGVPSPVSASSESEVTEPNDSLAWTSMGLRVDVVLHVGSPWEIHLGFDALENLLLGNTHVNQGGTFHDGLWRASQASVGRPSFRYEDALRVRHGFARWMVLEFLDLRLGRIPDQRGLGIWRQARACDDCDYGTYVDGARASASLAGFLFEFGWEIGATGASSELPGVPGQPMNLDITDDVTTWLFKVGGEKTFGRGSENSDFDDELPQGWVLDWSLHAAFTDQTVSTSVSQNLDFTNLCAPLAETLNGQLALPHACWRSIPRNATFYRPGGWIRAQWWPTARSFLRLELEFSSLIGEVGNVQVNSEFEDTAKNFLGFGAAFESEYRNGNLGVGLDMGFATGDDQRFLGVLDGQNILVVDEDSYDEPQSMEVRANSDVTSFWFHRDYRIDLILFRQVIGTITNAVYAKPWVKYNILNMDDFTLSTRLDVLYAAAIERRGTPGDGQHWGVEIDGRVSLDLPIGFAADFTVGLLLPMDGLADPSSGRIPDPVFGFRSLLTWRY